MNIKQKIKNLNTKLSALYLAYKRKDTPKLAKVVIGVAICYALSPIDLIPDFIPILGYLDDLVILPLLIALSIKLIPPEIMAQCEQQAKGIVEKAKSWLYAIPIILFWTLLIAFILYKFLAP